MKPMKRRWTTRLAAAVLALGLGLAVQPTTAWAQDDFGGGEQSSGRPLDGYFGTATLACLALFIVGKSARR